LLASVIKITLGITDVDVFVKVVTFRIETCLKERQEAQKSEPETVVKLGRFMDAKEEQEAQKYVPETVVKLRGKIISCNSLQPSQKYAPEALLL